MKKLPWLLLLLVALGGVFQADPGRWFDPVTESREAVEARRPGQAEIEATLALIERDGPFPHEQDGSTFHNRERRLPGAPQGYYREYTVETPGLSHRGPRRIVTGGEPPVIFYYTDDHYRSFVVLEDRR